MIQLTMRKLSASSEKIREYERQIERLEERIVLGKINATQADRLEEQINNQLNDEKNNYTRINADMDRYNRQASNILNESKKEYDYELFDLDDKVQLIKKVVDKVIVSRNEKKQLHIEIYNKYNDNVEHITLVRNWRNWVISK